MDYTDMFKTGGASKKRSLNETDFAKSIDSAEVTNNIENVEPTNEIVDTVSFVEKNLQLLNYSIVAKDLTMPVAKVFESLLSEVFFSSLSPYFTY